jgi:predicted acetyltransferase
MPLVLRKLESNDEDAFLRALTLTAVSDPNFAHYYHPRLDFTAFLHILEDAERGIGLPDGHVPSTLLFGFVEAEIVGRLMLRHSLNDFLLRMGGNIGFVVVPGHRGRGYATEMLRQGVQLASLKGMEKVLVTCDEDNIASRRTIEKCDGVYEGSACRPEDRVEKRRYWISLRRQ